MSLPHPSAAHNGSPLPVAWTADDPEAAATSPQAVCAAALRYVAAGLSVIAIDALFGSKRPDYEHLPHHRGEDGSWKSSWKIYQVRRPRPDEIRGWYASGGPAGLAVLGGVVSGGQQGYGLEIIDLDNFDVVGPWLEAVEAKLPGLITRLVMVCSPRPGMHVYFRSQVCGGCQVLASAPVLDKDGTTKKKTLIEVKGAGGYCVVPPSPYRAHPSNQLYRLRAGSPDLTQVPNLTPAERKVLLDEARQLNRWTLPEPVRKQFVQPAKRSDGNRPGDAYERRVSWADLLVPAGWTFVGRRGEVEDWRRPDKSDGISATINYAKGKLYIFSSNADPFEQGRSYDKFAAYAVLHHDGDFTKAARVLQAEGYGRQQLPAGKRSGSNVTTTVLHLDK